MRRSLSLAALVVIAAIVAACGGGGAATTTPRASGPAASAPAGGSAVTIQGFKFEPQTLTVKTGTEVVWTNNDDAAHSVKWSDGTPTSNNLNKGDTYPRTFSAVGTFAYVCGIHSNMTGSIVVQ